MSAATSALGSLALGSRVQPIKAISRAVDQASELAPKLVNSLAKVEPAFNPPKNSLSSKGINFLAAA